MNGSRLMPERVKPHDISRFHEPWSRLPFRHTRPDKTVTTVSNPQTPQPFSSAIRVANYEPPPHPPLRDVSPATQRPSSKHQHYETNMAASHSQTTMSSVHRDWSRDDFSHTTRRSSHTSDSSLDQSKITGIAGKENARSRRESAEISPWRWQDDEIWHSSTRLTMGSSDEPADDDDESHQGEDAVSKSEMQFPPLLPTIPRRIGDSRSARDQVTSVQLVERFARRREEWASAIPPSDSGTTYSADGDEIAVSWKRYRAQRVKIRNIRKDMAELRPTIRNLGRLRDGTDNDFMSVARYYATDKDTPSIPVDLLARHFRKMQARRTEFHEAETAYEQLEIELEREEGYFEVVEAQFFSLLYQDPQQFAPDEDNRNAPSPPVSLRGISGDRSTAGNPLYTDLADAIGDRDLAKEHLNDIVHERDRILYLLDQRLKIERVKGVEGNPNSDIRPSEKDLALLKMTISGLSSDALRHRFGSYIRQGDLEFLHDFQDNVAEARRQVTYTTREVNRLKKLCLERKIIDPEDETTLHGGTLDLSDCPELVDVLGHPHFHILMSNPKHLLGPEPQTAHAALQEATGLPREDPKREHLVRALNKEVGIEALLRNFTPDNKSDYINRWLLQRVVTSPLEVTSLFNVFSMRWQVRDLLRWQHDVNYHWKRDGANMPPGRLKGPLTSLDSWQVYEENTARVNWDIQGPSRAGSDGFEARLRKSRLDRLDSYSEP